MSLKHHSIPDEHFHALGSGAGGAPAARLLLSAQHSKHVLLIHGVGRAAPEAYRLLSEAQRHRPEAVAAVLRHPAVGAWAWRTYHALATGSGGHSPARLAAVAAAAAVRSGMDFEIEVPAEEGGIMLPSLGRAVLAGSAGSSATVRRAGGPAEVIGDETVRIPDDPHQDAPGWQALRRLEAMAQGASSWKRPCSGGVTRGWWRTCAPVPCPGWGTAPAPPRSCARRPGRPSPPTSGGSWRTCGNCQHCPAPRTCCSVTPATATAVVPCSTAAAPR
ncbi:hypothetical protein [Nonomuraea sp. NPDC048901]|uniref:hypothetical protein n=1 Tax=Nonomuraea sp. NPDC048901 TaxID=3155627 RepID=UPI0033D743A9